MVLVHIALTSQLSVLFVHSSISRQFGAHTHTTQRMVQKLPTRTCLPVSTKPGLTLAGVATHSVVAIGIARTKTHITLVDI